ncbi:UPF0149 family protein [Caviibacterium pharyngocola]|uniref:UPF0149 protein CVP04_05355 n=1 Tax=Caviibacterium pharyngocola TaxID=28159 RepID=A0A2M8RWE8_9PAST|nr:UPF0149 family protein [Caviibacterium pharyngocola]PJG83203.1 YecA family protein [Caviibacterium pharyngocola]
MKKQTILYTELKKKLNDAGVFASPSELHGFLAGTICSGVNENNWRQLVYQLTNDYQAYPTSLLKDVEQMYQHIKQTLSDANNFDFELCLSDEDDVFSRADSLAEWVNNFLLGLALNRPDWEHEHGELGEAVSDLQAIAQLGYDEDDDPQELETSLEALIEYVRTVTTVLYTFYRSNQMTSKPVLH